MTTKTKRPPKRGAIIEGKSPPTIIVKPVIKIPHTQLAKATMEGLIDISSWAQINAYIGPGEDFTGAILVGDDYDLATVAAFFYDPPCGIDEVATTMITLYRSGALMRDAHKSAGFKPTDRLDVVALAPSFLVKRRPIKPVAVEMDYDGEPIDLLEDY